jgi:hypothetical protein
VDPDTFIVSLASLLAAHILPLNLLKKPPRGGEETHTRQSEIRRVRWT